MASGVHRSERAEDRQVVEADSAHATQASWRSSSLRSRRRTNASPDRQANVASPGQSSPAAGDSQTPLRPPWVEPQISMGKVARTNVAVIRKVIATPSKIH